MSGAGRLGAADAVFESPVDETVVDEVIRRTIEICAVPGPPLRESDRGDVVQRWFTDDGLQRVTRDETGNVWAQVRDGSGPAIVVCAHLDTVFESHERHGAVRSGNLLTGPSVGDDSVALAALSSLRATLPARTTSPVWVLGTVGEEGLGDLAGVRAALADPVVPVAAMIAVEGNYLGRVCTTGVGSARWRVILAGPGGHAWEAADGPSAVHDAATLIGRLTSLERPAEGRSTLNVGTLVGGEAINGRARHAAFEVDVRSDHPGSLETLVERCSEVFASDDMGCEITVRHIGRRPAGAIAPDHALVRAAIEAHERSGIRWRFTAASTDANAAHAAGVPALAVGVTVGEQEHTLEEWIDLAPLGQGLRVLADTVVVFDQRGGRR